MSVAVESAVQEALRGGGLTSRERWKRWEEQHGALTNAQHEVLSKLTERGGSHDFSGAPLSQRAAVHELKAKGLVSVAGGSQGGHHVTLKNPPPPLVDTTKMPEHQQQFLRRVDTGLAVGRASGRRDAASDYGSSRSGSASDHEANLDAYSRETARIRDPHRKELSAVGKAIRSTVDQRAGNRNDSSHFPGGYAMEDHIVGHPQTEGMSRTKVKGHLTDMTRMGLLERKRFPGGTGFRILKPDESAKARARSRSRQGLSKLGEAAVLEAADSMAKASTPEPFSSSRTSNWVAKVGGLPPYIQHIAHDLMEKRGKSESNAIQMAVGIVKRWCRGGGKVDAGTKAAACKATAQWEAKKARAHAQEAAWMAAMESDRVLSEASRAEVLVLTDDASWLSEAASDGDGPDAEGAMDMESPEVKCPQCGHKGRPTKDGKCAKCGKGMASVVAVAKRMKAGSK